MARSLNEPQLRGSGLHSSHKQGISDGNTYKLKTPRSLLNATMGGSAIPREKGIPIFMGELSAAVPGPHTLCE